MKSICLFILLLFTTAIAAQTHIWTGNGGDTNWNNPDNWDVLSIPDATSDILISGPVEVEVIAAGEGATILVEVGAVLTVSNTLAISKGVTIQNAIVEVLGTLQNIGGSILIEAGAELRLEGVLSTGTTVQIEPKATLLMRSGMINGMGTIENSGTLLFEGMDQKQLDQITINNYNRMEVNNSGIIDLSNGMIINNWMEAAIDINSTGGITQDAAHDASVYNYGTITSFNNGGNTSYYMIFDMYNAGTINVQENQTFLFLTLGADFHNLEEGTLNGSGTYDITANFMNAGTINPGGVNTAGTLEIVNNFDFPMVSTLTVDVIDATTYDRLHVIGFPTLEGNFDVQLQSELSVGDELTVIMANDITACNLPDQVSATFGFNEVYTFEVLCDNTSVTLKVISILLDTNDMLPEDGTFQLFPNPTSGEVFYTLPPSLRDSAFTLEIFTLLGQSLRKFPITSISESFDISELPRGIYLVNLQDSQGVRSTAKMVKQ